MGSSGCDHHRLAIENARAGVVGMRAAQNTPNPARRVEYDAPSASMETDVAPNLVARIRPVPRHRTGQSGLLYAERRFAGTNPQLSVFRRQRAIFLFRR